MKIRKLFNANRYPYHMVVELIDGSFAKFYICPFRDIQEKDLIPAPFWMPVGNNSEEADPYMYRFYGFEKEGDHT